MNPSTHQSASIDDGQGDGASAEADRAVVNGAASVSAVPSIPSAADRWAARSAIPDAEIEAALRGSVPGGSSVWVWLPQEDAWTPHQTAREVMRSAIFALDQYRAAQGMAARSGETGTGSTEGNSPVRDSECAQGQTS